MSLLEEEKQKIRANPYEYIKKWMEGVLINVGDRAFSVIALMPCSLILPNIPFGAKDIRSSINLLYIAPAGTGKSTICEKYENFTYFPLKRRVISPADLARRAVELKFFSLIIEDFSATSENYDTIKMLEGILGEEQSIDKSNMRVELLEDVKATGLLCGTPTDLERYALSLEGGLLSRCMVLLISLSKKQHSEIGDYINSKVGESNYSDNMKFIEQVVKEYYQELYKIQNSEHEIKPIKKYHIEPEFRIKAGDVWKKLSEELINDIGDKFWIRDLMDFYRILIASAFLNIHNRKHDNGILTPNQEDYKIAVNIMMRNMRYKWAILKSTAINRGIRNVNTLFSVINTVPEELRNVLINISPYGALIKDRINFFKG